MISKAVIESFCSDDKRYMIDKPFNIGDFTFATDGRIAIKVNRVDGYENAGPQFAQGVMLVFKCHRLAEISWKKTSGLQNGLSPVQVDQYLVADWILDKIKQLPSCEIGISKYGHPRAAIPFRFNGGIGVLMPMAKS